MCRINKLYGGAAVSLGMGLLLGLLISSSFLKLLLGFALCAAGVYLLLR